MSGRPAAPGRAPQRTKSKPAFAALDLGTNNCRLLIAEPAHAGFRVVSGFSQIVRLGEGLTRTGRLSDAAIDRAMRALSICAARIAAQPVAAVGCIATQACRAADNGEAFLRRVHDELGLAFEIISPEEEARLAVLGCANLIDPRAEAALVVDIGGGSTELSWVDLRAPRRDGAPIIRAWVSAPMGVVTMSEHWPEQAGANAADWYESMVADVHAHLCGVFGDDAALRNAMAADRAHIVGTSGTVTSLAGVHLALPRYQRARVDGLWMSADECRAAANQLLALDVAGRASHPCIGAERADLVLAGCAILEAVLRLWPSKRLRVADRGLREGVLMTLMARHKATHA